MMIPWWRHHMETWSFDVFFDRRLNKLLSKPSRRRWFETPSRSLWHHCNFSIFSDVITVKLAVIELYLRLFISSFLGRRFREVSPYNKTVMFISDVCFVTLDKIRTLVWPNEIRYDIRNSLWHDVIHYIMISYFNMNVTICPLYARFPLHSFISLQIKYNLKSSTFINTFWTTFNDRVIDGSDVWKVLPKS